MHAEPNKTDDCLFPIYGYHRLYHAEIIFTENIIIKTEMVEYINIKLV